LFEAVAETSTCLVKSVETVTAAIVTGVAIIEIYPADKFSS